MIMDIDIKGAIVMLVYVAHPYSRKKKDRDRAVKITRALQLRDMENTYVCPIIALSHLAYSMISREEEIELRLDILSNCERLIVVGEITNSMRKEVNFAKLVRMEVVRLEESGALRPFTE